MHPAIGPRVWEREGDPQSFRLKEISTRVMFSFLILFLVDFRISNSCTVVRRSSSSFSTHSPSLSDWSYGEQSEWSKVWKDCGGSRQSPVPLPDYCSGETETVLNQSLRLVYRRYHNPIAGNRLMLRNNGHSVQVMLEGSDYFRQNMPQVTSEPEGDSYQFMQLHFHWEQVCTNTFTLI